MTLQSTFLESSCYFLPTLLKPPYINVLVLLLIQTSPPACLGRTTLRHPQESAIPAASSPVTSTARPRQLRGAPLYTVAPRRQRSLSSAFSVSGARPAAHTTAQRPLLRGLNLVGPRDISARRHPPRSRLMEALALALALG